MKIEITRSGGFGGLTRTWSLDVSRSEAEQRWLPLAQAATEGTASDGTASDGTADAGSPVGRGATAEPAAQGAQPAPGAERDRFTYRIAIGYTEVYLPESRLEDPWRELIQRAKGTATADTRSEDPDPGKPHELL